MTWYWSKSSSGQGLIIDECTGRNVAVAYDEQDAPLLAEAPALLAVVEDYLLLDELHDYVGAVHDAARMAVQRVKGGKT